MFETLPQWMQDAAPWLAWVGLAGVVFSIIFDVLRRWRRFRAVDKSVIDD